MVTWWVWKSKICVEEKYFWWKSHLCSSLIGGRFVEIVVALGGEVPPPTKERCHQGVPSPHHRGRDGNKDKKPPNVSRRDQRDNTSPVRDGLWLRSRQCLLWKIVFKMPCEENAQMTRRQEDQTQIEVNPLHGVWRKSIDRHVIPCAGFFKTVIPGGNDQPRSVQWACWF